MEEAGRKGATLLPVRQDLSLLAVKLHNVFLNRSGRPQRGANYYTLSVGVH